MFGFIGFTATAAAANAAAGRSVQLRRDALRPGPAGAVQHGQRAQHRRAARAQGNPQEPAAVNQARVHVRWAITSPVSVLLLDKCEPLRKHGTVNPYWWVYIR